MIFEDPTRRRWRIALASFTSLALLGLVLVSLSAAALMTNPELPGLDDETKTANAASSKQISTDDFDVVSQPKTEEQWEYSGQTVDATLIGVTVTGTALLASVSKKGSALSSAFLLQQDSNSVRSFKGHTANLDVVYPDWFFLSRTDCSVDERINSEVTSVLRSSGVNIVARLTDGEGQTSYQEQASAVMNNPTLRTCVAQKLADVTIKNGGKGLLVDIESLDPADGNAYLSFLIELQKYLHAQNMWLIVVVPSGSQVYPVDAISKISDAVLVVMHGEHYAASTPGPLASQGWFEETLNHFSQIVPADKLLVGLGSYGMDWPIAPTGTASGLTYGEIMSTAKVAGALPKLAPKSLNTTFGYQDASGAEHNVWVLDAVALWNQWKKVQAEKSLGVAVWRLGSEDPNIWSFLARSNPNIDALKTIGSIYSVYSSTGSEIFKIQSNPTNGEINISQDKDGLIQNANYTKLPSGYILSRVGSAPPEKTLVLAFSGGPDPIWTPRIMDTLSSFGVPAVFFVTGSQAGKYPDVLQKISAAGYVIGNRSDISPSDLQSVPTDQLRTEVNATQRMIENATNRHSLLFETNYPNTPEDVAPLTTVADLGYVIVAPNVTPKDWQTSDANQLVADIEKQIVAPESHIISLHDGGGDRSVLISALKTLIPALQSKGYKFIRMDEAIGVSQNQLLPSYNGNEAVFVTATNIMDRMRNLFWPTIFWLFLMTTSFSLFRILFMSIFVLRSTKKHGRSKIRAPGNKFVSVLIPAYNEEKTIGKTLESLQASTHQRMEMLVIDDGSTDNTAEVVEEYAIRDPRIRLLRKPNGGKATALNMGMREATYDIAVTIDADTILLPETVNELIKPFGDPTVDAVCGNVEVGNVHNVLTGFQALEYITAQNFDRRCFEELNAISVVPGATGAWKRQRVLDIGGYESDTLTEDADLTIKMLASGGRIVYAPNARSRTEAPDNLRDLSKQRFRWSFGTFQCLGKYSNYFFRGAVGWVALPNIFIFQIIFPLLAPIGDAVFILSLIRGDFSVLFWSYIFFTIMDVIGSMFAFLLEHKPKRLMLFVLIQRFYYRQFMYVTIIRAIIAMLRGRRYGWNKLQRTGTVAAVPSLAEKAG
ncbi:MAG: glycosyltransferase [Patescibacteria group bacterium]|nr:glycosyltransferase [Patescibacteria group bacterium]